MTVIGVIIVLINGVTYRFAEVTFHQRGYAKKFQYFQPPTSLSLTDDLFWSIYCNISFSLVRVM